MSSKNTRAKTISRIVVLICLLPAVLLPTGSEAQQPKKVPRIGNVQFRAGGGGKKTLQDGLGEFGYVEGENILIEWRSAEGHLDRLSGIVAELVSRKVDLIVLGSVQAAQIAKKSTQTIPIVFATADDPVATGLIAHFSKPGED